MPRPTKADATVLHVDQLVLHPNLQMRAGGIDEGHADDLAAVLRTRGGKLPRVMVVRVADPVTTQPTYYVVDGFHTTEAHRRAGKPTVPCLVRDGAWEDAVLAAAGANNTKYHLALKRTNADKRRAVERVVDHFPDWSAQKVAHHVGVGPSLVHDVKRERSANHQVPDSGTSPSAERTTVGLDGKRYRPKHQAPAAGPVAGSPPVTTGVQAGDWRGVLLAEFLDAPDHVWATLDAAAIHTAGTLDAALRRGETFRLDPPAADRLAEQVGRLNPDGPQPDEPGESWDRPAPKPGSALHGVWREIEPHLGRVMRAPDTIARAYPGEKASPEYREALRLLEPFAALMKRWQKRLQQDDPPE